MALLKDNHPQRDFFVPDMFDNLGAPFKDDIASMAYPLFVLSKKKDLRNLEYRNGDVTITIKPTTDGLPTIFDKDVLLYCASLLMTEVNAGRTPPKSLRVSSHDLLTATNRQTNDDGYRRLKQALNRLTGVLINTNIKTNKREINRGFGLLDSYEIIESSRVKDRMVRLEITLSDWFYNSILGKEVLTIHRDYFRLGKPIERRLYEIARKHCGASPKWEIGLIKLMDKTGSAGSLRLFRSRLKQIIEDDHLPDYHMKMDDTDKVTFTQKINISDDELNELPELPFIDLSILQKIKPETANRARDLVDGTGWDFDEIIQQWADHMQKTGAPNNINGALIGFVKNKIKTRP